LGFQELMMTSHEAAVEERRVSCLAHEAAVEDTRPTPEVPGRPDGYKLMKQQEAFARDAKCQGHFGRSRAAHELCAVHDEHSDRKVRIARSISAHNLGFLTPQLEQATVPALLFPYGQPKGVIKVPENISKADLRKVASNSS
jgi:hypothetical protein